MSETKAITYTESREAFFVKKLKKAERGLDNLVKYGTDPDACVKSGEEVAFYQDALAALRAEEEGEKVMEWGKMESSGGVLAICPECKYPVSWWHKTPFCGNCGRKLDGGGQDE